MMWNSASLNFALKTKMDECCYIVFRDPHSYIGSFGFLSEI